MVLKDKKIPQNVGCKILIEKMCLSCCIKSGAHVQKEMKKKWDDDEDDDDDDDYDMRWGNMGKNLPPSHQQ